MNDVRRRAYLVDPPFQLKLVFLVMAWGAVLAVAVGLMGYEVQQRALEAVRETAQRAAIARSSRQMLAALGGMSAFSLLLLGLVSLLISHRVAGPLRVLSYFLELLAEGRYPPPRALRRHDELKAFHAHFLETVESMKTRDARLLRRIDEVLARARRDQLQDPALAEALRELELDAGERRRALAEASPPPAAAPGAHG
jgi:signal transduction histidine kinase